MRPGPRLARLFLVALCVSNFGCWWTRKPARATPPPAPPPRATPPPAPPPRPTAKKKTAAKPKPAGGKQEPHATREQPKAAENAPAPSLGQMLSPEERAELTQALDRNLSNARQAMSRLSGHPLTLEQSQTVSLVQSLLAQADKARHSDLTVAAQLARRADLLARDLLTSVR